MEKAKILLVLPAELKKKLEDRCKDECRSMNSFITLLLTRELDSAPADSSTEEVAEVSPKKLLRKK